MKRCGFQGKIKFRDAGDAARFVDAGEHRGLYLCPHCGFYHLTKQLRSVLGPRTSGGSLTTGERRSN